MRWTETLEITIIILETGTNITKERTGMGTFITSTITRANMQTKTIVKTRRDLKTALWIFCETSWPRWALWCVVSYQVKLLMKNEMEWTYSTKLKTGTVINSFCLLDFIETHVSSSCVALWFLISIEVKRHFCLGERGTHIFIIHDMGG